MLSATDDIERDIVLVIEDEPVLRLEVVDLCEEIGFDVIEAMDVEDAIAILETRPDIRIVYIDLDMPKGIDGVKIAAAIRDRWPPIDIILTASTLDAARVRLPVRAEFFAKPIDHSLVARMMRSMGSAP
ncbi:response regulator [Fulvimarina sp. MAC3]|uniref:response regulator n=1 Tax=Fulvimarina sp. MAC3 TaxID=3148887 RepID=UPI0031FDC7AA